MKKDFCVITIVDSRTIFFFFFFVFCNITFQTSFALLHFKGKSFSFSFVDAPASFALPVNRSGICGALYLANPLDACSSLRNSPRLHSEADDQLRFALIERGNCQFEDKVRNAQDAGFQAAIVYDDRISRNLISMSGNSQGIWVHAVFISKRAGEILQEFALSENGECCISSSSEGRAWTVLVISIFSLIIMVSVFAMFLFVRNHWIHQRQAHQQSSHVNRGIVKSLPSVTFVIASRNDNHTAATCAICLEDYRDGEKLRVLPCQHEFHATCVDVWLTKWGTCCPVCKLDVRNVQV